MANVPIESFGNVVPDDLARVLVVAGLSGPIIGTSLLPKNADRIAFDNVASGLTATDVQAAIDEIKAGLGTASAQDYEEGTFTPGMQFQTPGDVSWTYATQLGGYTRIGDAVMFAATISAARPTYTTASGFVYMTGLPFIPNVAQNVSCVCMPISALTWPAGSSQLLGLISSAYPGIAILSSGDSSAQSVISTAAVPSAANRSWRFSGLYKV